MNTVQLDCGLRVLDLTAPLVMGVLNVTPDSFSDGGRYQGRAAALAHALQMVEDGAAIIDVGGESTRPGAAPVSADEEIARVLPVIEALARETAIPISIDTSKPEVMCAATAAGACLINDVRALRQPGALEAAAASGAGVCLMHMRGEPQTMQQGPDYTDAVAEVRAFLATRVAACELAGIGRDRLCVDPGIGFGKRLGDNLALLAGLGALAPPGIALLVGISRKSLLGMITGRSIPDRLAGSVALAAMAVSRGARIVRAHDVAATVDAVKVAWAVCQAGQESDRG